MIRAAALFGLIALTGFSATAQSTLHYREGQRVDPEDVAQILGHVDAPRTRSIRVLSDDPGAAVAAAERQGPGALSLPVQFDFDSATILPSARAQLDALAEGIRRLPENRQVVIEGHTDAQGADDYNQRLSLRRAAAVRLYLVEMHGIDARRLRDVGMGERQPIAGFDPYAPENRRVQFRGG
jgi:outer membrane protein OmpA-like peptidoglycan-associated protein